MRRWRLILTLMAVVLLAGCVACWLATLREPGRLVFLPGGDVGMGFKSVAGRLEWIEYAPWDRQNMDYAWWSAPWWVVVGLLAVATTTVIAWPRADSIRPDPAPGDPDKVRRRSSR